MRNLFILLFILLFIILFLSCKTEIKEIIELYPNGNVMTEYVYPDKSNKNDYSIIEYYENRNTKFIGIVKNGKFIDVKLNYYENGILRQVDSIINPCNLDFCCCDGKVIKYYRNGKLDQAFENRNGVANGIVSIYDSDSSGILWNTCEYLNDNKNGAYKEFYKSGQLSEYATYHNDTLIGNIYYFKENGDTIKIINHFKGKKDFPVKKWLVNGQIFYATYVDNTYKNALFRWTDKNGQEIKREVVKPEKDTDYILPD